VRSMPLNRIRMTLYRPYLLRLMLRYLGLSGLSSGSSRHDFINHRMEKIGIAGRQLVDLIGENEAGRLIVQQMNKKEKTNVPHTSHDRRDWRVRRHFCSRVACKAE
jgi:hypothetical protein